jgi:hypothetical protein
MGGGGELVVVRKGVRCTGVCKAAGAEIFRASRSKLESWLVSRIPENPPK